MSELKKKFDESVNFVKGAEGSFKPSNDLKLDMYALYKQATEGDASGSRPGFTKPVERAKYDAWAKLKGKSSEDAMQRYIDTIEKVRKDHG